LIELILLPSLLLCLNLDSATINIIGCVLENLYFKLHYCTCIPPGFSIIKELTVEVEPPIVQKSLPPVEDGKVSTNGASTEKEDGKSDKSAVAEEPGKPGAAPSDSKPKFTKSPLVSPVKNKEDGYTDEPDKKQSVTNDASPRATESIRYAFFFIIYNYIRETH
jgi:hypothetical protein